MPTFVPDLLIYLPGTQTSTRFGSSSNITHSRSYSTSTQSSTQSFPSRTPLSQTASNQSFGSLPRSTRPGRENHIPKSQTSSRGGAFKLGTCTVRATGASTSVDKATRPGTSVDRVGGGGVVRTPVGGWSDESSPVVCNCGDDGRLFTVHKEGPNTGQ